MATHKVHPPTRNRRTYAHRERRRGPPGSRPGAAGGRAGGRQPGPLGRGRRSIRTFQDFSKTSPRLLRGPSAAPYSGPVDPRRHLDTRRAAPAPLRGTRGRQDAPTSYSPTPDAMAGLSIHQSQSRSTESVGNAYRLPLDSRSGHVIR